MTAIASQTNQWSGLRINGDDSRRFLQGQLSNDVELVNEGKAGFFALCTPKGRTLANFFIAQEPGVEADHLLILVPSSTAETVLATLAKYIVFSKAELKPDNDWHLTFVRLDSDFPYAALNLSAPASTGLAASQSNDRSVFRLGDSKRNGLGLLLQRAAQLHDKDLTNWRLDANERELALIHAGIGLVQESNSDEYVPQMLNMQLNNGVSFTKGCYTGQEIVARAQYRGKIKRRMYRVACELEVLPSDEQSRKATDFVGKELIDLGTGKSIGAVISAAHNNDKQLEFLAVLSLKEDGTQKPALETTPPTLLTLLSLPYDSE